MGEPISESAHSVVRSGGTDLFLIQQGRLEAPGAVPILWDRRAEGEALGIAGRRRGSLGAARRRAVRIIASVFNILLLVALI